MRMTRFDQQTSSSLSAFLLMHVSVCEHMCMRMCMTVYMFKLVGSEKFSQLTCRHRQFCYLECRSSLFVESKLKGMNFFNVLVYGTLSSSK